MCARGVRVHGTGAQGDTLRILTQDLRGNTKRAFRTAAPTKAAALSRMRDIISDIGVPVRIISLDIVRH